jgi:hypothetical protein
VFVLSEDLIAHLKTEPEHAAILIDHETATIIRTCEQRANPRTVSTCLFCGHVCSHFKIAKSHIARHLEDLALFATPQSHIEDSDEDLNDELSDYQVPLSWRSSDVADLEEVDWDDWDDWDDGRGKATTSGSEQELVESANQD